MIFLRSRHPSIQVPGEIDTAAANDKIVAGSTSVRQTESLLRDTMADDDAPGASSVRMPQASSYASLLSLGAV